jgi:hypothetical protein
LWAEWKPSLVGSRFSVLGSQKMHPVSVRKAKNGIDHVAWLGEGFPGQPLPSGFFVNCEHIHVRGVAFILVVDAQPASQSENSSPSGRENGWCTPQNPWRVVDRIHRDRCHGPVSVLILNRRDNARQNIDGANPEWFPRRD